METTLRKVLRGLSTTKSSGCCSSDSTYIVVSLQHIPSKEQECPRAGGPSKLPQPPSIHTWAHMKSATIGHGCCHLNLLAGLRMISPGAQSFYSYTEVNISLPASSQHETLVSLARPGTGTILSRTCTRPTRKCQLAWCPVSPRSLIRAGVTQIL